MNEKVSKNSIFFNLIWRFAERCGAQVIQLIVSIVLARILAPEAYGTVALVVVIAQISQVFVDSGLGNALIQKKEVDDLDYSSVFYFNVVWCLIVYGIIFFSAPMISSFYNDMSLIPIIRVLCLTVVVSGLKNVQQAYVSRNLQFKKFFFATLGGTLLSAIIGILLALAGTGVWALVAQKLVNLVVDTLVLWFTVEWRPKCMFSFKRLKVLISYGWKLLISALLDTVYGNLRQLLIGKIYSKSDLAYYNQGDQFPNLLVTNINSSIDSVLLPTMSKEQDNKENVKNMTRRAIKISTFVMAPLMFGLFVTAENVVKLVLSEKWIGCVPFLQIFCVSYLFYPIHTSNLNAIKAMGRSDLFLKLEVVKKVIGLTLLIISMKYGVMAIALSSLVSTFTGIVINSWPNKKLLNYYYIDQLKDMGNSLLLASIMGIGVYFIGKIHLHMVILLIIQVISGCIIYIVLSIVTKNESFFYLLDILKHLFEQKEQSE